MTGWLTYCAATAAVCVAVFYAENAWNRRRSHNGPQSFAHLTVMAVEQQQVLIAYVHPSGSGMFWMGKRQVFERFVAAGTTRTVLRAANTDGTPIEMPVSYTEWAHIVEAV